MIFQWRLNYALNHLVGYVQTRKEAQATLEYGQDKINKTYDQKTVESVYHNGWGFPNEDKEAFAKRKSEMSDMLKENMKLL